MTTPDTTLRTALTKLADDWPGGFGETLRALLAAHPAPETARSGHDIACDADYLDASCICDELTPAPVSDARREAAEALCLADTSREHHDRTDDFPCSSCVSDTRREDMARVRARAIRTADIWDASGEQVIEAWDGEQFTTADLRALSVLSAPLVVDEAQIGARALDQAADAVDLLVEKAGQAESAGFRPGTVGPGSAIDARDAIWDDPAKWLRDRATALRGADR